MNYTHLSQSERYQIQCLRDVGLSITQTALRLGRHRSTIAREIRRNSDASTAYQAHNAHQQALSRQSGQTNAQRFDGAQWELVLSYLQLDLSPQQAAARLGLERRLRISHTCIYNRLRRMGQAAPRLRCGHCRRKAHRVRGNCAIAWVSHSAPPSWTSERAWGIGRATPSSRVRVGWQGW
ncbi:transposase [Acidovorax sp. KKS102]|uniref:helix-turn-helix domain-containing protein n=1 Tax=Acidovorax sp. KKS102 TaxID=358220 RepID=UPI00028A43D5|nr:transposase [Acidovorax sp. KKS102]AFU44222.1 transposase [Acidovorax sp. KKS102]AFU45771.1 transposase [Acidovorax sp. KKS102]AFU46323.1 transposase [Acidovorax sp. KKS102]AFU47770.1 transposase [Acidovorax sp. KKS102]